METPSKPTTPSGSRRTPAAETPQWRRYDRSARKKSARALIEKVVAGDVSDEDDVDQEDVAREIYESEEEEEDEEEADGPGSELEEQQPEAATPSKTQRGRKKKQESAATRRRKRSPTPPANLPPHELYFAQTRPGQANKTSNNTLAALQLLTHEEYFSVLQGGGYINRHADDVAFLQAIHAESFPQWAFELAQGFSVCLYGYGSKRRLLSRFAAYLYEKTRSSPSSSPSHKIVIINGYVRTSSLREILGTVAAAVDRTQRLPAGGASAMLAGLRALLLAAPTPVTITLVLNSVDAAPLRRPGLQAALAQLAALPGVRLICSADTPDFALLWDSALRSRFNFAFHDCTTFAPLAGGFSNSGSGLGDAEEEGHDGGHGVDGVEADAVDDVHELLGRRARRVGGKEGVSYVLRSLPENAKNLFRLLVGEVLAAMDDDGGAGGGGFADGGAGENPGIEYRMVYNKAVEEFICSSEMAFRTLLKE